MSDPNKKNSDETAWKQATKSLKIRCYLTICWFVVLCFAMIGVVTGHDLGMLIAVVIAIVWVNTKIINEAIDAWTVLSVLSSRDKKSPNDDSYDK